MKQVVQGVFLDDDISSRANTPLERARCILMPGSWKLAVWNALVVLVSLFYGIFVPMHLAFEPPMRGQVHVRGYWACAGCLSRACAR